MISYIKILSWMISCVIICYLRSMQCIWESLFWNWQIQKSECVVFLAVVSKLCVCEKITAIKIFSVKWQIFSRTASMTFHSLAEIYSRISCQETKLIITNIKRTLKFSLKIGFISRFLTYISLIPEFGKFHLLREEETSSRT